MPLNRRELAKEAAFEVSALADSILRISKHWDLGVDDDTAAVAAISRRMRTLGDAIAGAVAPDDGSTYEELCEMVGGERSTGASAPEAVN